MKKNTHPRQMQTRIILHNGSSFSKKWMFFKKILKTDFDFLNSKLWLFNKK